MATRNDQEKLEDQKLIEACLEKAKLLSVSPDDVFRETLQLYQSVMRGQIFGTLEDRKDLLDQMSQMLTKKLKFGVSCRTDHLGECGEYLLELDSFRRDQVHLEDNLDFLGVSNMNVIFNTLMRLMETLLSRNGIAFQKSAGGFFLKDLDAVQQFYYKVTTF